MKNVKLKITLLVIAAAISIVACKKDTQVFDPVIQTEENNDYFGEKMITSSIGGTLIDENENAVANAQVSIGNNTTTTDVNGVFLFRDIVVNEKRTFVKANKSGFFFGSRALYPSANEVSYVKIQMLSNSTAGSFSASSGGVVSNSGVTLNFPANSVKIEGGGAYSGTVNVAVKFLDPTSDKIADQMPGDLMAVNSSNQLKILETFGMTAVELTSPSGQKLNVADGKKVELKLTLSGSYLSDAPATIPLWYFNESEGIWKEEGSATKVGNEYVGEVSHFSFWNCDNPNPSTSIQGTIVCGTNPAANARVTIKNTTSGRWLGSVSTNSAGQFSGFLPMNTALTISVFASNPCNTTPLYTASIGPFTSPVILPSINACTGSNMNGNLTATLQDCSGAAVSNGVLEVKVGFYTNYYFPNASGNINTNIVYCSNTSIDIQAFDYTNSKQSSIQTISTSATMSAGNISICGAIDEYITYNLDGTNYRIDKIPTNNVYHYTWGGQTTIYAYENSSSNNFTAKIIGASTGTFTMEPDSNTLVNSLNVLPSACSMNATFTTYGTASGSYKIGSFTGTFTDASSTSHTLNGNFRLKNP